MNKENVNQGYAVEGKLKEVTKGYIVLWTMKAGQMRYENLCEVAKANGMNQLQIPHLRSAKNAFAVSKDVLHGMPLNHLEELEGWDGPVKQSLQITFLKRGNEYQVSIKREGMMNGKLHKEAVPVVRLVFSPPDNLDHRAWITNYMRSFWDKKYMERIEKGEDQRPEISDITRCINLETYWDETRVDPLLMNTIRQRIVNAFQTSVVSVDKEMLRSKVETIITKNLNGINFLAGRGAVYVPSEVNGKKTSETLDSIANLIASFKAGTIVERNERNYYDEDGKPIARNRRQTEFRYLGYLSGSRELEYIRKDIGASLSQEIAEYWDELAKVTDSFNKDKVDAFEKKLTSVEDRRTALNGRIANICSVIGGDIPIETTMYTDINEKLTKRISSIPTANNAVAKKIQSLANFEN